MHVVHPLQAPRPPVCRRCSRWTARGATPGALTRPHPLARPLRAPAHAGTKKHSPQDKRGGRDKEPKTDEVKKSKGRSLELNETLATIAHLYASKERNPDGLRNEKINKKDFWRIFGEVILMRQQLEVSSPRAVFSACPATCRNRQTGDESLLSMTATSQRRVRRTHDERARMHRPACRPGELAHTLSAALSLQHISSSCPHRATGRRISQSLSFAK